MKKPKLKPKEFPNLTPTEEREVVGYAIYEYDEIMEEHKVLWIGKERPTKPIGFGSLVELRKIEK